MKNRFAIVAMAGLSLCATAFAAQNVIKVDDLHPGIVINKDNMMSADLAIWNPPSRYYDMTSALIDGGYTLFRFPNGSLSNDYHWNGIGRYDDTGLWITDSTKWARGFLGETIYRGTTKDNYGFVRRSHLADNNMETMWWGEILDPADPPWVVAEFPEKIDKQLHAVIKYQHLSVFNLLGHRSQNVLLAEHINIVSVFLITLVKV